MKIFAIRIGEKYGIEYENYLKNHGDGDSRARAEGERT